MVAANSVEIPFVNITRLLSSGVRSLEEELMASIAFGVHSVSNPYLYL